MGLIHRRKSLSVLCLLWGILLGVLALEPEKIVEIFLPSAQLRSLAHVAAYGALAFIACLFWKFKRTLFHRPLKTIHVISLSFAVTTLLGGFTEVLQIFTPDRCAEIADVYFDMMGAASGISCFFIFRRWL